MRRVRLWLSETHGVQFELIRHFFSRQLASDLVSSDQARRFFVAIVVVIAGVGTLVVRIYMPKYGYLQGLPTPDLYLEAVRADRLFFVSLSMLVVGFTTALQWQSLFPNRQDYLTLKPLPLRLYEIFIARFLAAFAIAVVVIFDLNLTPSLLFPLLTSGKWQSLGPRYVVAHAVATVGAGLFVFFALAAFQGVCLNLLSPRAFERLSVFIQALFVTGSVAAGPYVIDMPNWYGMIGARPNWMFFFPPAWFLGLYERLLGTREGYLLALSKMAIFGMAASVALALGAYFFSYRWHAVGVLEQSARIANTEPARIRRAFNAFCVGLIKNPHDRAVFDFSIRTLQRSHRHKLLVGYALGAALLLALESAGPTVIAHLRSGAPWSSSQLESAATAPLIIGVVLTSALRYVFQMPCELRANWVFRMAESVGRQNLLNSVERMLILFGLLPALLVTLPIELQPFGWLLTLAHTALSAVLMLLFIELGLREWHKIPFTCSYVPGRRNVWAIIGTYFIILAVAIPATAHFEVWLAQPFPLFGTAAGLIIFYLAVRFRRQKYWESAPLQFEESEEPLLEALRLSP